MYTWTISSSNWLLRWYLWCWGADQDKINFCKLFWGIAGSLIGAIITVSKTVVDAVPDVVWRNLRRALKTFYWSVVGLTILAGVTGFIVGIVLDWTDTLAALFVVFVLVAVLLTAFIVTGLIMIAILNLGARFNDRTAILRTVSGFGGSVMGGVSGTVSSLTSNRDQTKSGTRQITGPFSLLGTLYHAIKWYSCPTIKVTGPTQSV